ncbi:hypothetical protein PENTCL1PPCAC_17319, partial [Pristionchus entomophagus]
VKSHNYYENSFSLIESGTAGIEEGLIFLARGAESARGGALDAHERKVDRVVAVGPHGRAVRDSSIGVDTVDAACDGRVGGRSCSSGATEVARLGALVSHHCKIDGIVAERSAGGAIGDS